jgi:hypothetical protein
VGLGSESETCVGSRVHLVGVSISFKKNFYRLPLTPPPSLVRRTGPSVLSQDPKSGQRHLDTLLPRRRSPRQGLQPILAQQSGLQHHIRPLLTRSVKACTTPCCTWIFRWGGHKGWWSSPNFASTLLAPRDGILALCSGGRTQSQCMTYYQAVLPWSFHLIWLAKGSRIPIYSNGAQHR